MQSMVMSLSLSALAFALMLPASASAGWPGAPRSEAREQRQALRITQGVVRGALTPAEARRLQRSQQRVDAAQHSAAADGVVTVREKLRLERLQDRQSMRIARQKHDRQLRHS